MDQIRRGVQIALPPLRHDENNRRYGTCACGQPIMSSGFGWVHTANAWVRLGSCADARPRTT